MGTVIRAEQRADLEGVRAVNLAAFGQPEEADLVDRLREVAQPFISLVAEIEGRVVGHILFTAVTIEGEDGMVPAIGLAPMAVEPSYQRTGIGSALVERGLEACREGGHEVVVVLGHPQYYPRFGFQRASAHAIRYEAEVPDEVFMVLELSPGALAGRAGIVHYHPEFSKL